MAAVAIARKLVAVPNLDDLPPSALLTRNQVAALTGFAVISFKKWAVINRGPKITRVEGRPRYRAADVTAWLNPQDARTSAGLSGRSIAAREAGSAQAAHR